MDSEGKVTRKNIRDNFKNDKSEMYAYFMRKFPKLLPETFKILMENKGSITDVDFKREYLS